MAWYYRVDGAWQGPVSAGEIRRLAEARAITPQTEITKDSWKNPRPAREFRDLFSSQERESPSAPEPSAEPIPSPDVKASAVDIMDFVGSEEEEQGGSDWYDDEPKRSSLFGCPDCDHKISKIAKACPNCGREIHRPPKQRDGRYWAIELLVAGALWLGVAQLVLWWLAGFICFFVHFDSDLWLAVIIALTSFFLGVSSFVGACIYRQTMSVALDIEWNTRSR